MCLGRPAASGAPLAGTLGRGMSAFLRDSGTLGPFLDAIYVIPAPSGRIFCRYMNQLTELIGFVKLPGLVYMRLHRVSCFWLGLAWSILSGS